MIGAAATDGKLISAAAEVFGSQSIVAAVDVKRTLFGRREVWTHSGTTQSRRGARAHIPCRWQHFGAGELFVQSIDLEGARSGYDVALLQERERAR